MPRYRLIDVNGKDLGTLQAATRSWSPGEEIRRGSTSFVVVNVTEAFEVDDVDAYLVVRAAE